MKITRNFSLSILIIILIFSIIPLVFPQDIQVSYCCERTIGGAYCQNMLDRSECESGLKPDSDQRYLINPVACDATSYCKKGCCYDSDEGICMPNSAEEACRVGNGLWDETANCAIPQCDYGCCVLGTEAAFSTFVRCNKLAGLYGLRIDFREDITDELSCIAIATSQDQGACVYESNFINKCKFTTQGECNSEAVGEGGDITAIKFHKDLLCTAEELGTECRKTEDKTICKGGKVYFVDTCGNVANIYDASQINSRTYWTKVIGAEESCTGSPATCGNCDYLGRGSICTEGRGASIGDFICSDVNCYDTSNGKDYKNGESWCYYDEGGKKNDRAGARHYRHICILGEEIVEPCADFRNEVCVEDSIEGEGGDFSQAGCVINKWQDCVLYGSSEEEPAGDPEACLNRDQRDCMWIPYDAENKILGVNIDQLTDLKQAALSILNIGPRDDQFGLCVPKIAPGLKFWDASSQDVCSVATQTCTVKYEKSTLGDWECAKEGGNCFCEEPQTALALAFYCSSLGDCGPGENFIGRFVNEGYEIEISERGKDKPTGESKPAEPTSRPEFGQGSTGGEFTPESRPAVPATGGVVQNLIKKITGDK